MYDEAKGVEGYQKLVDELQEKYDDPQTPQGEVKELGYRLSNAKRFLEIAKRKEYEKDESVSVYGSDDYVGCGAGEYSFYLGYEVTKCPIESHKDEDYCYEKDCDKREWVFQASKDDRVIFEKLQSELSYPQADNIERELIVGLCHFIKDNLK